MGLGEEEEERATKNSKSYQCAVHDQDEKGALVMLDMVTKTHNQEEVWDMGMDPHLPQSICIVQSNFMMLITSDHVT
jgi:hypothetical protein